MAEERLIAAAAAGEEANLRPDHDDDVDPPQGGDWGEDRTVRADVIYALCLGLRDDWPVHAKGVRLRGARIDGQLDLEAAVLTRRLQLQDCYLDQPVVLRYATAPSIQMIDCWVPSIAADGLRTSGDVFLKGVTASQVSFLGANIGGSLMCSGGTFTNPDGWALNANRLTIQGSVLLRSGFTAEGEVNLAGADIGGDLNCSSGTFSSSDRSALNADSLTVRGDVLLHSKFSAKGEVCLMDADIGGSLVCSNSTFTNTNGRALNAHRLTTKGAVFLRSGFTAEGEVNLARAAIGASLECSDGIFTNRNGEALNAANLTTKGDVFLDDGFRAEGEVSLVGADIGGQLTCRSGTFTHPNGRALNANRLTTERDVLLADISAQGEVNLMGADIGGQLACRGGTFTNPSSHALDVERCRVSADVLLDGGFAAEGRISLRGADIGGDLSVRDAELAGLVQAKGMRVAKALRWSNLTLSSESQLDLSEARVGTLDDDLESWPSEGALTLTGFTYQAIAETDEVSANERLGWLRRQPSYTPQLYQQLALVYRNAGRERDSRRVLIAQHNDRRRRGDLGPLGKAWNLFLGITVSHGYRPWQAAAYLLVLVIFGGWLFQVGFTDNRIVPTSDAPATAAECVEDYPCFHSTLYALDLVVPIIDLRQQDFWRPDASQPGGWIYRYLMWASIALGWVLTTAVVAGVTTLLRRE